MNAKAIFNNKSGRCRLVFSDDSTISFKSVSRMVNYCREHGINATCHTED